MTEAQWLTCSEPGPMLDALGRYAGERKLRLFACACARRVWELLPDARCRAAIEVAERFADGRASAKELADAAPRVRECVDIARRSYASGGDLLAGSWSGARASAFVFAEAEYAAALGVTAVAEPVVRVATLGTHSARAEGCRAAAVATRAGARNRVAETVQENAVRDERAAQADLLRDLFTDQFRPVLPHPEWFTSDVMALARAIYDGRAFDQMPILADALQDAGCDSDDVLNHCRGTTEGASIAPGDAHVRGCWVLDLVLALGSGFPNA